MTNSGVPSVHPSRSYGEGQLELNLKSIGWVGVPTRKYWMRFVHSSTVGHRVAHCEEHKGVVHLATSLFKAHFHTPTWLRTALQERVVLYHMRAMCCISDCQCVMFASCTSSINNSVDSSSLLSEKANPE